MFRRILSAVKLTKAFKAYRDDDLRSSRRYLQEYLQSTPNISATAIAFDGTLLVLEKKTDDAGSKFLKAKAIAEKKGGKDANYVVEYCNYYICLIENNRFCDKYRTSAISIGASKTIMRWLPLPEHDVE